jgi:FkbH-like protein
LALSKTSTADLHDRLLPFGQAAKDLSYSDSRKAFAALRRLDDETRRALLPQRLTIAVGGNVNTDFMLPAVGAGLAAHGIDAETVGLEYDSWITTVLEHSVDADYWVIWLSSMGLSRGATERREADIVGITAALKQLVVRGRTVIAILPEALHAEDDPYSDFAAWRRRLIDDLDHAMPAAVIRYGAEHLQRRLGGDRWFAGRYWTMAKCPCHPDAASVLSADLARIIARCNKPAVRAVIVDLDNTLWGGVVGDDGPRSLKLDPDGDGRPFIEMQRFLKDLQDRGIPLNVVSKNEPEQARRPFLERPEMILKLDDFVYFDASWDSKSIAIQRIIDELNLGIDQVCFLDDSPHERAEAAMFLPQLIIPALDEDPERRLGDLLASGLFLTPSIRKEDQSRVAMYKSERARKSEAVASLDIDDYLRSLKMELQVMPVAAANLPRVSSLVQKTNQFNLTTQRFSPAEIDVLAGNPDNYAYCFSVNDRFGASGIVAVLLARRDGANLDIEIFLMSCRVFNRGLEFAIAEHLAVWAQGHGVGRIQGYYEPTEKNALVADLYLRLGFVEADSAGDKRLFIAENVRPPAHFLRSGIAAERVFD